MKNMFKVLVGALTLLSLLGCDEGNIVSEDNKVLEETKIACSVDMRNAPSNITWLDGYVVSSYFDTTYFYFHSVDSGASQYAEVSGLKPGYYSITVNAYSDSGYMEYSGNSGTQVTAGQTAMVYLRLKKVTTGGIGVIVSWDDDTLTQDPIYDSSDVSEFVDAPVGTQWMYTSYELSQMEEPDTLIIKKDNYNSFTTISTFHEIGEVFEFSPVTIEDNYLLAQYDPIIYSHFLAMPNGNIVDIFYEDGVALYENLTWVFEGMTLGSDTLVYELKMSSPTKRGPVTRK